MCVCVHVCVCVCVRACVMEATSFTNQPADLKVVEHEASAKDVRVYTHKVWLFRVYHHLYSFTVEGDMALLEGGGHRTELN